MAEYQEAFDAPKEASSIGLALGYSDFSKEFILETDAFLKSFSVKLSQQGDNRTIHVFTRI